MRHAVLEEVEVLHTNFDIDFTRQTSMKRVAIDVSMLATLPELSQLEELAVVNVKEDVTEQLLRFSHIARLTLSGSNIAISSFDSTLFNNLNALSLQSTSYEKPIEGRKEANKFSSSASSQSTSQSTSQSQSQSTSQSKSSSSRFSRSAQESMFVATSFDVNDNWTNTTFTEAICNASVIANTTSLTVRSTLANTKWFKLPSCLGDFAQLETLRCTYCQFPNMNELPSTLRSFSLTYAKDSWTQSKSGRVTSASPFANYFDWSFIANLPLLNQITMTSCGLIGTMPNEYNHTVLSTLDVSGVFNPPNQLTGTISPDFFVRYPALATVSLANNQLTGTVPYSGIENLANFYAPSNQFTHWPSFVTNATAGFGWPNSLVYIDLGANKMVQIPSYANLTSLPSLTHLYLADNTNLSGTVPNIFNQTIPRTSANYIVMLDVSRCNFSGPLPAIPDNQIAAYSGGNSGMLLPYNQFTGTIPSAWSNMSLIWLYLAGNPGLTGTIAQIDPITGDLFAPMIKDVGLFSLSSEGITGPMFNTTAIPALQSLNMRGASNIDFCGSARIAAASNASSMEEVLFPNLRAGGYTTCNLELTNVTYCNWAFPSICKVTPIPPPTAPVAPVAPVAPTPSPVPVPAAFPCPLPSPGPSFICVGKTWVSTSTVTTPSITVPPGSTTYIGGNLTTDSVSISGASTTITVAGCIETSTGTETQITITLTQADIEAIETRSGKTLTTQLLTQSSTCKALSPSAISIDTSNIKSCKRIETDKVSNSAGLAATFSISSSKCNRWWIILVSVLCALVLITIVIVVVVVTCSQKARETLQPFSKRRTLRTTSSAPAVAHPGAAADSEE